MSIVFDGAVDPVALTTLVRQVPTPVDHLLAQILPPRTVADSRIRFDEIVQVNRVAKFRPLDATVAPTKRDTASKKELDLPALSVRSEVGEQERLLIERARFGGSGEQAAVNAIYNDTARGGMYVGNRLELARGGLLDTGKVTISAEEGIYEEADFGVPSEHFVSSAVAWSDTANAMVVSDLTDAVQIYVDTNGFPPIGMVVSRKQINQMIRNAEIRSLAQSLGGTPHLVTRPVLNAVLDAFGLPPILFVYDTKVDVDGTTTRCTAEEKVIFVGQDMGFTAYGITATALELVNSNAVDFSFENAAGVTTVQVKGGPPFRVETWTDALAMPVLSAPRRLMVMDTTVTAESSSS